jgi:hypothetical protein
MLRGLVLSSRVLVAIAFVGLMPGSPNFEVSELAAQPETPRATVANPDATPRAPARISASAPPASNALARAHASRSRTARTAVPQPAAAVSEVERFKVVRTGQFDLGLGPFGESPLAYPALVEPNRHPRAKLLSGR